MAQVIGNVKSFEAGTFFVKGSDGQIRQLKVGDSIYEGEKVYGATTNGTDAKILIDVLLAGAGDLVLGGDGALTFDTSVLVGMFSHNDAVVYVNSLKEALATISSDDAGIDEDITDAGETAAGDAVTDTERAGDIFAARTGAVGDVTTDLRVTSANIAQPTVEQTEVVFIDTTATPAPGVIITEDINDDGTISNTEISGTVGVLVTAPTGAVVGDTLNVTNPDGSVTQYIITQAILDDGLVLEYARPEDGVNLTVSATITDIAGNTSVSASDTAIMAFVDNDEFVTTPEDIVASGTVLTGTTSAAGDVMVTAFNVADVTYTAGETASITGIGTLTIAQDGSYTFIPVIDYSGEVPVTVYSMTDGSTSDTSTLTLSVTPVVDTLTNSDVNFIIGPKIIYDVWDGTLIEDDKYITPEGIIITGSDNLSISKGLGIGIDTYPYSTGEEANRMDPGEWITFDFTDVSSGMQGITVNVKNTSAETVSLISVIATENLIIDSIALSGDIDIAKSKGAISDVTVAMAFQLVGSSGTLSIPIVVNADGTWSIVDFDASSIGTLQSATLITDIDGDLFNNGGDTLTFYVNNQIEVLSISDGTMYSNADGFQIDNIVFDIKYPYTYPIDINAILQDLDTSEEFTALSLSGFPDGSVLFVGGEEIIPTTAADGSQIYILDTALLTNTYDGVTFNDMILLNTPESLDSTFKPTIMLETTDTAVINGVTMTDQSYTIIGGTDDSTLVGSDGDDYINGGDGNDTLISDVATIGGVLTGDTGLDSIDGGSGVDTIILTSGSNIDFAVLDSANNPITNIEVIDLSLNGDHQLHNISHYDVMDITGGGNTLTILGDAADSVSVDESTMSYTSTSTDMVNGVDYTFDIYTSISGMDPTVTLRIETVINSDVI